MDDDSPFQGPPGDDDLTIPRAAMNKLIKELCPNMRVATESRYSQSFTKLLIVDPYKPILIG
jgi:hypothetical protein